MSNNILKTLFVDCADAIRETLPDIGKISPNAFPDNIRAVAKAGGGGSDTEETIYWKQENLLPASVKAYYRPFVYNDNLHFLYHASATAPIIYSYIDGVLTELFTADVFTYNNLNYGNLLEYKGKLHIVGGESKKHCVWDGTTLTQLTGATAENLSGAFIHCNKLYGSNYEKCYLYNDDLDTWTLVKTFPDTICDVFPINEQKSIISLLNGHIYEMDSDLTITLVAENGTASSGSRIFFHNNAIYSLYIGGYGEGCFKIVNGEKVLIPDPTHYGQKWNFIYYQNSIRLLGGSTIYNMFRKNCVLVDNT